jgi:acyl-CoA synthetase (AMP-forming)/AMP-acid ligase II
VIQVPNGIAFAVAVVATLAAGGCAVLCEPGLGDDVYFARLRAAAPRWALVHPVLWWINRVPGARALLRRREVLVPPLLPQDLVPHSVTISNRGLARLARQRKDAAREPVAPRRPEDDGIIIFTGGTTSLPKGVRLGHGALGHYLHNIAGIAEELGITRFLADTPQQVLYALSLRRQVLVTKGRTRRRARFVLKAILEGRVDAYFGSPFLWVEMMAQGGEAGGRLPESLRAVLLGGAPVTSDFLTRLRGWLHPNTAVRALYGLTEAGPVSAATDAEKLAWTEGGDFVGFPLPGVEVRIDTGDSGDIGEVVVHSEALYRGYIGQPPRCEGEGLHTGDLGRLVAFNDRSGLVLLGRKKDMIIRAGVNIYPPLFEAEIRALKGTGGCPLIRECALIGLWNPARQDEAVVLCYEPAAGVRVDEEALRDEVCRITGADAAPDYFLAVTPIPVTGRQNKIDKQVLRVRAAMAFGLPADSPDHVDRTS